jgi:hypothetical protein
VGWEAQARKLGIAPAAAATMGEVGLPAKWSMAGVTFTGGRYCPNVTMGSDAGMLSLDHLASTGASWVALVVTNYQWSINTTEVFPLYNASEVAPEYYTYVTIQDADLEAAVRRAHALGLKVM